MVLLTQSPCVHCLGWFLHRAFVQPINMLSSPNTYTVHVVTLIWSEKEVTGYCPEGRRSHCAITYGSSVLYYGGYNAVYKQHFGDLFLLDTGGRVRESCMRMWLSISLFCSIINVSLLSTLNCNGFGWSNFNRLMIFW